MASITLEKVKKIYATGFEAVHGFDLHVNDGEFVVLVGPSGCGKTTILRMIAGLDDISDGLIFIGDRVVNKVAPKDRDVAMVFQNYALYPHMTVAENIAFALKLQKIPKSEIETKVLQVAEILGLKQYLHNRPRQLSGGQRQRVAMGRAIVREPAVFLMDEPLSNLDASLRVQMRAEVLRIQRHLQVGTLYVTHDQVEAMTMGDRVVVLKDGYIQQCDTPENIYSHPANLFVAAFIGSPAMNLFKAGISNNGSVVDIGSQNITLGEEVYARCSSLRAYAGKQVVLGVRPEHLTLAEAEKPHFVISSIIGLVEVLGSDILAQFSVGAERVHIEGVDNDGSAELDENEFNIRNEGIARLDPKTPVHIGEKVALAADFDSIYFFDPVSGNLIN